jgi:hypothetical protein
LRVSQKGAPLRWSARDLKRAIGCGNLGCAKRGSGKGGDRKGPAIHDKLLIVRECCKTCAVSLGQNTTQRTQM